MVVLLLSLVGCGNSAKSDKEIVNEIIDLDSYFTRYSLSIDDYSIDKRQTNKDDKTDFVWINVRGSNDEFTYYAEYEITYVLYNDGWMMEDYFINTSSYSVKGEFDKTALENDLGQQYDSYSYVDSKQSGNNISLMYVATKTTNYILKTYDLKIEYSYTPETSWTKSNIEQNVTDERLDIIGEWIYSDDRGYYYYIHVSEVNEYEVTYKYLFQNGSQSSADWDYVYSDGYNSELYLPYVNEYTGFDGSIFYRYIDVYDDHVHVSGDKNCIWFYTEKTLMVDGDFGDGFYINSHFLERMNDSAEPIIGLDTTYIKDIESDGNKKLVEETEETTESDYKIALSYCEEGDLDSAIRYINGLQDKSDEILSLENEVVDFEDNYSKWLGEWSYKKENSECALLIRAGYDDGLVLLFVTGKNSSGEEIIYDLYDESSSSLVYHSDRFSAFNYTTLQYISDGEISTSTHSTNTDNTTAAKTLYRIK